MRISIRFSKDAQSYAEAPTFCKRGQRCETRLTITPRASRLAHVTVSEAQNESQMKSIIALLVILLSSLGITNTAAAGEARAAVAANFTQAAKEISKLFESETGNKISFSFGSTGQLYAQISQGAPFDMFLSADQIRAQRAVTEGFAVPGSRFSYATGTLALFSRSKDFVQGKETLFTDHFTKIAIANPLTAPYGAAALETIKALGGYEKSQPRLVQGNSIAQAYQFVYTGNAELGFVALSQIIGHNEGSRWVVPNRFHTPIAQDAVLLTRGAKNEAARAFLDFLKHPKAHAIMKRHGYDLGK